MGTLISLSILINISLAKLISLPIMTKGDIFEVILLVVFAVGFLVMAKYSYTLLFLQ